MITYHIVNHTPFECTTAVQTTQETNTRRRFVSIAAALRTTSVAGCTDSSLGDDNRTDPDGDEEDAPKGPDTVGDAGDRDGGCTEDDNDRKADDASALDDEARLSGDGNESAADIGGDDV